MIAHAQRVGSQVTVPDRILRLAEVQEHDVLGSPVLVIRPRPDVLAASDADARCPVHLIYLHGGGFVLPIAPPHWAILESLLLTTGATITVPLYPRAPEHTYVSTYEFLDEIYSLVTADLEPGGIIVLAGDSAGGGLAIGLAIRLKEAHQPPPAAIIAFSPWVDLSLTNAEIAGLERRDPVLVVSALIGAGELWAGETDVTHPLLSPVHADLSGMPPLYIYQGGRDIMLPDVMTLTRNMATAGGDVEVRIFPAGSHLFISAIRTPESKKAVRHAAATIKRLARKNRSRIAQTL
nr:alpha/beta hydrolase fold domain-containing protein [Lysinibacter cavernae]